MVLSYMHIMKKIYLKNYVTSESDGWMLGAYAFLWFHLIIALGISLSASHLSDLTLTIVANIFWSLLNNIYKTYYIIFTNKHLNTDQLVRLMALHYLTPWYYLYLVQLHAMFCHESWDAFRNRRRRRVSNTKRLGFPLKNHHKTTKCTFLTCPLTCSHRYQHPKTHDKTWREVGLNKDSIRGLGNEAPLTLQADQCLNAC
jgi:hypothetical protein